MKKIASNRNYRLVKRAEGEVPKLIIVSGFEIFGSFAITARGVAANSAIVFAESFEGKEKEKIINDAKTYIVNLKQKYPNVKINTDELKWPDAAALGL